MTKTPEKHTLFAQNLAYFAQPLASFQASEIRKTGVINNWCAGGLIFSNKHPNPQPSDSDISFVNEFNPSVLLIRRSKLDFLPGLWECPGGSCDQQDLTILETVAREVYEETGLSVSRVSNYVTSHYWVESDGRKWGKWTFIVEVDENADGMRIKLAEDEHDAYRWVTEQEVRNAVDGELGALDILAASVILQGFDTLRKSDG